MKLNRKTLRKMILNEIKQLNESNSGHEFNPQYRASRMMMGGGRANDAVKNPNDETNFIQDASGDYIRNEDHFEVYMATMMADTIANRLRTRDMAEAKRIGNNSLAQLERALALLHNDLKPIEAGGLNYVHSMVEGAALHMFLTRIIGVVKSL